MASYEKVNYSIRPAKCIERKMLAEAFQRLWRIDRLDHFRYVGFGSTYFTDFILFHKALGFNDMISIEKDIENEDRFRFNCPFACVNIEFGESNVILPSLDWDKKNIVWLDYDGKMDKEKLQDVDCVCSNVVAGSVIIVSVNAEPGDVTVDRLKAMERVFGRNLLPTNITVKDIDDWGTAKVYRTMIDNQINSLLRERNGILPAGEKLVYKQLFNFHYKDGARMLSTGGLIFRENQVADVEACHFESLPYFRDGSDPFLIEAPNLTYREIRHLDSQLPEQSGCAIQTNVPVLDQEKYKHVYRYFPSFVEAEL